MQTALVEEILTRSPHILPTDAQGTEIISSPEFAGWFKTGTIATDGVVDPADSLNFRSVNNFSFHKWAKQMFFG